jgi:hypothetical protein
MTEDKISPITVIALRAHHYSPDGKNIIISVTTSEIDRKYSVSVECFNEFIAGIRRLSANADKRKVEIGTTDQHQPGCFALEEERGEDWKGTGKAEPIIKEAKPSL